MQKSLYFRITGATLFALALAACQPGYQGGGISPDAQRAAGGAVIGGLAAKALDEDVATGALAGGAAGALCDDVGVCQRSY